MPTMTLSLIQSRSMGIRMPFIQNVAVFSSGKGKYIPSVGLSEPTPAKPSVCLAGVSATATRNVCSPTYTVGRVS